MQAVITMNGIVQVQPLKFKFPAACKCANIYLSTMKAYKGVRN